MPHKHKVGAHHQCVTCGKVDPVYEHLYPQEYPTGEEYEDGLDASWDEDSSESAVEDISASFWNNTTEPGTPHNAASWNKFVESWFTSPQNFSASGSQNVSNSFTVTTPNV